MFNIRLVLVCHLILIWFGANAQFEIGSHPSDIRWQQIDNKHVKVIYPTGQNQKAQRIANLIELMATEQLASIGLRTKKIDLVLQTNQVVSNGYAALSPYRTEFFGTPFQSNQFLGSINWLDALTIHEYRHALQYTNANRGITRFFNILQGQNGWAVAMNLSVPDWFFEGDATMTETVLSDNGRGRTSTFFKEQRALILNNRHYAYMKARNGSFKDLVPDHYRLGYTMINYGRNQFDSNLWAKVLADAGRYRSLVYPFSGALKRHTGMRSPAMYRAAYGELEQKWRQELNNISLTNQEVLRPKSSRLVTDQRWPNILQDGSLVYLQSSYQKTPAIYQLKDGRSEQVTTVGISAQPFLSEQNGKLAWTELRTHPRWANRNYSVIMTYDMSTGVKNTVTRKSKYFSPEFAHHGTSIATVEVNNDLDVHIHILDAETGTIKQVLENSANDFISYPKWSKDDQSIIYLAKRNSQLAFLRYHLASNQITELTEWNTNAIGSFNLNGETLVYSAGYSGIDNIYALDLDSQKNIRQLTSVPVGAYDPDISEDGSKIVLTEFTDMGAQLTALSVDNYLNQSIKITSTEQQERYQIQRSATEKNILTDVSQRTYTGKAYNDLFRGMKLHSWSFGGETNLTAFSLQFQNILNDVQAELLSSYNTNEQALSFGGRLDIARWFTAINLATSVNDRSAYVLTSADTLNLESFTERNLSTGLSIPLRWIYGNYTTNLRLSSAYVHRLNSAYEKQEGREESIGSIETSLSLSNIRRRAVQNVLPRFGQIFQFSFSQAITGASAEKFNLSASLFFPGLMKNHGIRIDGAYQKELLRNDYQFPDGFFYARGYGYPSFNDQVRRLGLNYQLPLLYPDWGFWGLIYFKRVRANLFYDIAQAKIHDLDFSRTQSSTGAELLLDNTYFNVLPLTLGLRYSYLFDALPDQDNYDFSFFFIANF
jgi:hypothetical protein